MIVDHWFVTYNSASCGAALPLLAGKFLLDGPRRSFGSAVNRFDLYAWVKTRGRAQPNQGDMKKRFYEASEALPRVVFLRRIGRFDISFVTSLGSWEDLERKRSTAQSLKFFHALCHEMASALRLAKRRLKKADDFDWNGFESQLAQQLEKMPKTEREFTALLKHLKNLKAELCNPPSRARLSAKTLKKKPRMIAIDHDEHHATHIGRLPDGRQFFLTTPFVPAPDENAGREFVALYLFEKDGRLLEARVDDLGTRAESDKPGARLVFEQKLVELGPVNYCRIRVQPFEITRFGITFGLVPRLPEDDEDEWCVEAQPGNYMAFYKPWKSGDYDT